MTNKVTINGHEYEFAEDETMVVIGKVVRINGMIVQTMNKNPETIKLEVSGTEYPLLHLHTVGAVDVTGSVGVVETVGPVTVGGTVAGDVKTTGSVSVGGSVEGDVKTVGRVEVLGNVSGKINTVGKVQVGSNKR